MGIGLTVEETKVFCEALYNLAKGNSRIKGPVKIDFSGDNNAVSFGARRSFVKPSGAASGRLAQTIIIEPVISAEDVAKISLQTQADQSVFFCSAILTSKDALILAHMLRYDYHEAFYQREFLITPRKSSRSSLPNMGEKPEPGSDNASFERLSLKTALASDSARVRSGLVSFSIRFESFIGIYSSR
jgi:hypothetical protein